VSENLKPKLQLTMENVTLNATTEQENSNEQNGPLEIHGMSETSYTSLMHISQFAGVVIPGLGLIAPIGMWLAGKEKSEAVNRHGVHILNWMITISILLFATFILCFIFIGLFILPFIILMAFIFPIIGTVKASNGNEWVYPLSFKFLKVK